MALPSSAQGSMYNNPGRQGSGGQSYNPNPLYQPPNSTSGQTAIPGLPSGWTQDANGNRYYNGSPALTQNYTNGQVTYSSMAPAAPTANSPQPQAAGSQPATSVQNGVNNLADQIQGLQPFDAGTVNAMVNSANAQAQGGAYNQNQQLRNQAAASGFGAYNPSLINQQAQNVGNANSQVLTNQLNIPMQAAEFNAQYGTSLGQLGALEENNTAQYNLGQAGLQTGYGNALLQMLGSGLFGGS